jgi:DNA-binding transcriptional LysR family regulator
MEMQQIRYFLSLAKSLNFTRAAADCNVSQPALTRAIQSLESELGGELLRRERNNSHLTDLGKRMLPLLQQCYDSALTAKSLAKSVSSNELAPLSLAVSHSVNLEILMPPISEMFRVFPGIQLTILRGNGHGILEYLKGGECDLAVAGRVGEEWDRLDTWPIFVESFELAVHRAHELALRNELETESLAGEQILLQAGSESNEELAQIINAKGISESSAHQLTTFHDLNALVEANLGVAILPASAPHSDLAKRVPVKDLGLRRTVAIYAVAGRRRSPPAVTLLNLLRSADWLQYGT